MMGEIGKIQDVTKFRKEGDKIYTFKPQPHRFLSFFVEGEKNYCDKSFLEEARQATGQRKAKGFKMHGIVFEKSKAMVG